MVYLFYKKVNSLYIYIYIVVSKLLLVVIISSLGLFGVMVELVNLSEYSDYF